MFKSNGHLHDNSAVVNDASVAVNGSRWPRRGFASVPLACLGPPTRLVYGFYAIFLRPRTLRLGYRLGFAFGDAEK